MAKKKPVVSPTPFPDAQILWECEFPDKPDLLESLVKERIELKRTLDAGAIRVKAINASILEFFKRNRIASTGYDGFSFYFSSGKKTTVSIKSLVEAGIPIATIKQCAKSTPWETIGVRGEGEKESHQEQETEDV